MDEIDYSLSLLGKKLREIDTKYLENFFTTERSETDNIEFKSLSDTNFDKLVDQAVRGVSAFLNSSGGIFILGAPREVRKGTVAGPLTGISQDVDKDRIVNIVTSNISPTPAGIQCHLLQSSVGKCVFIFNIQRSAYSPHQDTRDGKYYMRLDGQTKFAPHHYIEALFKRITYPNLQCQLVLQDISEYERKWRIKLTVIIRNETPYQNEQKLYIGLKADPGNFINTSLGNDQNNYYRNEGEDCTFVATDLKELLFYGEMFKMPIDFLVSKSTLDIGVNIRFGGRYSPLKFCSYVINVEDFNGVDKDFQERIAISHNNEMIIPPDF